MTREERITCWTDIIEQQSVSGKSALAWCRENHVSAGCFYAWRRKLKESYSEGGFLELKPCSIGTGIRIHLGGTLSIEVERGFDPFTLRAVVETLQTHRPCSV